MKNWIERNARWLVAVKGVLVTSGAVWMMWTLVPWWVAVTLVFGLLLLLSAWKWETTCQVWWLLRRALEDAWYYARDGRTRQEREWDENVGK